MSNLIEVVDIGCFSYLQVGDCQECRKLSKIGQELIHDKITGRLAARQGSDRVQSATREGSRFIHLLRHQIVRKLQRESAIVTFLKREKKRLVIFHFLCLQWSSVTSMIFSHVEVLRVYLCVMFFCSFSLVYFL